MIRRITEYRSFLMGTAILWIVLFHTLGIFIFPGALSMLQKTGYLGVDIFMFASGYGLYYSYKNRTCSISSWYRRRIFRIYPSFLLVVLLFMCICWSPKQICDELCWKFFFIPSEQIVYFWYIPACILTYLLFPFFFRHLYFIRKYYILITVACYLTSYFLGFIMQWQLLWLLYRLPAFIGGMLFAVYELERPKERMLTKTIFIMYFFSLCCFVAILLIKNGFLLNNNNVSFEYSLLLLSLPFILLTSDLLSRCRVFSGFMNYCGKYSLEIYLLHSAFKENVCSFDMGGVSYLSNYFFALAYLLPIPLAFVFQKLVKQLCSTLRI